MKQFSQEHFKEIGQDEKIIKLLHRHWFNILEQYFVIFIMALLLVGSFFFIPSFSNYLDYESNLPLVFFLESTFLLFIWIYVFFVWIDYYFDIWIVTSKRIINIEQKGLFVRQVSELKLERIQDVTTDVYGFLPTMLNFGDVQIQTAAEEEHFVFRQIPNPYGIKNLIMGLQKNAEREETNELGEMIKKEIHEELA